MYIPLQNLFWKTEKYYYDSKKSICQIKHKSICHKYSRRCGVKMAARLPEALADCLEEGLTSDDATLIDQDGGRHPVSKPILAVNSKFFLALFSRGPDQQNNFPITIVKRSSSTAEGLALVLSSMVREEVDVEDENVHICKAIDPNKVLCSLLIYNQRFELGI